MPTTDIGQMLKEETFSEVDEKMVRSPDKDRTLSTSEGNLDEVIQNPEYLRYLELRGTFCGKRLDKLIRKVDLRVLPQLVIIYLMSYVDRSNVSNAKLFGMLADLGLSSQDWNVCLSIFFITYAAGGTPSNIALKYFGPKIWLPTLLSLVSLVLVGTGLVNNYAGMAALRVLLGLFEAGVFPGCSFVLTAWYEPGELYRRMAIFYSGDSAAGAFSGLLAYGIGQLDGTWGYRGWRFIYVIEGVFTLLCALSGFYFIYDTPAKVKWLSDEEREFLLLRAKFSAGGESGVAEETTFSWKYAGMAMKSFHIYACALIEFTCCVAVYGYSFVLPSIINDLGFSAANAQAMTVPPYVFACIITIFSGWIGDKYRKRMLLVLGLNVAALIGLVIIMHGSLSIAPDL
ncbi:hypothetical protein ZTR_10246 [Talaromyces verruculosus]|nr:hypothetical protein ZTR_10246 [Talaromyces verruculosus]